MSHLFTSKIDKFKSRVRASRQPPTPRPTTPPSPGSFWTKSPTTRSVYSDHGSVFNIPPVPERPPPLPEVMPIMATPTLKLTASSSNPNLVASRRRPSTETTSEPGIALRRPSTSTLHEDHDPFPPTATAPEWTGHKKAASFSRATMYTAPSDALSPNSLFSPSSTISSPSTTAIGSYNSSVLAGGNKRLNVSLNASDPILPHIVNGAPPPADSSPPRRQPPQIPAPIRIPNGTHRLPLVDRSVDDGVGAAAPSEKPVAGPPPSPPPSPGTTHDAFLASAFVLSSASLNGDHALSSGGTGLARMDSATLPRDSYLAGGNNALGKLRGPRPIRTNSRRQSVAPSTIGLRRSASAASFRPSTPPAPESSTMPMLPPGTPPPRPTNSSSSSLVSSKAPTASSLPSQPWRPTVVVSSPEKQRRISEITELSSAGSVYSVPDELRPSRQNGSGSSSLPGEFSGMSLPVLPTVTASPFVNSMPLPGDGDDDHRPHSRISDSAPVLDQLWEFLLPDGSQATTPRSGSSFATAPSPQPGSVPSVALPAETNLQIRPAPTVATGLSPRSTTPNTVSPSTASPSSTTSPKQRNQKPSMLKLTEPHQQSPRHNKSFEIVQDSTPESPEFKDTTAQRSGGPKGRGGKTIPSVPQTASYDDFMSGGLSRQTSRAGQSQHPPQTQRTSTSPVNGTTTSSNGHGTTNSNSGAMYLSMRKDSMAGQGASITMWPETPRSSGDTFSPAISQTFTVEATPANPPKVRSRVPTLPIGPRAGLAHIRTETLGTTSSSTGGASSRRPSAASVTSNSGAAAARNPLPPSPKFNTAPVRWKGLTYDAARWTLSSDQLQDLVARAIKQSAESSSIRLLQPNVIEHELPDEIERMTRVREDLRTKLKAQIRARRVLLRKVSSTEAAGSPAAQAKLFVELMDACAGCDQTSEELFHVSDQLAQVNGLRDVHQASALALALRKINTSFVRVSTEAGELRSHIATLEAEREEAWHTAESVERELNELREKVARQQQQLQQRASTSNSTDPGEGDPIFGDDPPTRPSSRVSAARKASLRASKASLRLSARKSRASSIASSRYTTLFSPDHLDGVPPVPPIPNGASTNPSMAGSPLAALTDFSARLRQSMGASSFVSYTMSPSPEQSALATAQAELLELLGLQLSDIASRSSSGGAAPRRTRPRSASDAQPATAGLSPMFTADGMGTGAGSSPVSPRWTVSAASPTGSEYYGRRLRRSMSDFNSTKGTGPRPDSMLLSMSRENGSNAASGLFEDAEGIFALMTRVSHSTEPSPLPGLVFPTAKPSYF